jgi:hypothetical protein
MSKRYNPHPQIHPEFSYCTGYYNLHIVSEREPDRLQVGAEIIFKDIQPGEMYPPCPLQMPRHEAQQFFDRLWASGLRPSEARDTAGMTEAMKAHIEDLRRVAFKNIPPLNNGGRPGF